MEIRAAKSRGELRRCLGLFMSVYSEPPYNEKWTAKTALKKLSEILSSPGGTCLYATENGKVIGLISSHTYAWHDGAHALIEDLAVSRTRRGEGTGKLLVGSLERMLRRKKVSFAGLLVNRRSKARHFWDKLGYRETGYFQVIKKLK